MRGNIKQYIKRSAAAVMCAVTVFALRTPVSAETLAEQQNTDYGTAVNFDYGVSGDYAAKLAEYEKNGYSAAKGSSISVKATDYISSEKAFEIKEDALLWKEDNGFAEWRINVGSAGLYRLKITYRALENESGKIRRALEIDGETPFDECTNLTLYRIWRDKGNPTVNTAGDEVRPAVEEIYDWQTVTLTDTYAVYGEGLEFYLSEGVHTVKLLSVDRGMYLRSLEFVPAVKNPAYSELSKDYAPSKSASDTVRFEAEALENTVSKNTGVLRMGADGDPATTPFKTGYSVMNIIGGDTWTSGAAAITWKFNIKQAGYYCLGMRVRQNYRDGLPSYRRIAIDGKVPFSELEEYKLVYNKNWYYTTLGGDEPYYIWLDSGEHTLTMSVVQGGCGELYKMLETDSLALSELVLKITMITGQNADPNYDFELEKYIPGLIDTLKTLMANMEKMMKLMLDISENKPAKYHQLESMITRLRAMTDDPFVIATRTDELNDILTSYGTWMSEVRSHPLAIDYFELSGKPLSGTGVSRLYERLWCGAVNFCMTFIKDYSNVASTTAGSADIKETLDVWIGRGTNWANLIKRMSDEEFTANTGIDVKINILPSGQLNSGSANALLLAVSSGRAPDVSMGTAAASVGEFSMRNAVTDLTAFSDFEEVKARFLDKLFIPMTYKDGVYGLPETMDFHVMMYRKDIMAELGIHLPDTWEELREYVVPILYRNNMEFYLGTDQFNTFLYQNGGSYYSDDLFYSAIGSSAGYKAFKEYTDLFTLYGVPVSANFFNRFRSGEMPIGIVSFALYMQITAAAPELYGKCGIALIPGTPGENGKINRTYTGISAESVMIMEQSAKKQAAWEFIKWWTDSAVQSRFGEEIESLMGETARWNTANLAAFTNMAWDHTDLDIIMNSYNDVTQIPVVLGGYFTTRHITNAFNRTVISGTDAMTSLEKAVKDINRELKRRRK